MDVPDSIPAVVWIHNSIYRCRLLMSVVTVTNGNFTLPPNYRTKGWYQRISDGFWEDLPDMTIKPFRFR